ncbi:hypothetical protein Nepgr_008444 [Nepenthes gracilis]|uniref:Uncharacterized protein n=1 Tax=Nepenthes gracilis TaxID=150966 RepID=A0AAD3S908_NEPGR|nr:hypothetical protein Nepgr_008444 [Nepenthes gracilis]
MLDSAELISSWITNRLKPKPQKEVAVVVKLQEEEPVVVGLNLHAKTLKKFLGDKRICFVGVGLDRKLSRGVPPSHDPLLCRTVELYHLVACICKELSYCNSDLKALAVVYEVPYEPPASGGCCGGGGGGGGRGRINYEARVFLREEVKALVRDAYICYKIGQKLVEELYRDETTQETQELAGNESVL